MRSTKTTYCYMILGLWPFDLKMIDVFNGHYHSVKGLLKIFL